MAMHRVRSHNEPRCAFAGIVEVRETLALAHRTLHVSSSERGQLQSVQWEETLSVSEWYRSSGSIRVKAGSLFQC